MSKKPKDEASPQAIGAHFATVQQSIGGELIKTLKQCISAYTVEHQAEYVEMVNGYGEQAKTLYDANTAKTRKSEFKKVIDHASAQETRRTLFNMIDDYDSVQKLVKDLRALESGKAKLDENGKLEKIKQEKPETETVESVTMAIDSQPGMIEALEAIMQSAYDAGYLKAADLIQQAMASIGRGEKE